MNYKIILREGAVDDVIRARFYYEKISNDLANKFLQSFKEKLNEIEESPLHFQMRYKSIRIASLKKFPFSIHFIIEGTTIYILKILHQKRFYK